MSGRPPIHVTDEEWRIVRAILHQHVPGYEVWAFGSRATRSAKPYSDLDLAIITEKPISMETLGALTEAFTESDLPWKVDIVDWATTTAELRDVIRRDGIALHAAAHGIAAGDNANARQERG